MSPPESTTTRTWVVNDSPQGSSSPLVSSWSLEEEQRSSVVVSPHEESRTETVSIPFRLAAADKKPHDKATNTNITTRCQGSYHHSLYPRTAAAFTAYESSPPIQPRFPAMLLSPKLPRPTPTRQTPLLLTRSSKTRIEDDSPPTMTCLYTGGRNATGKARRQLYSRLVSSPSVAKRASLLRASGKRRMEAIPTLQPQPQQSHLLLPQELLSLESNTGERVRKRARVLSEDETHPKARIGPDAVPSGADSLFARDLIGEERRNPSSLLPLDSACFAPLHNDSSSERGNADVNNHELLHLAVMKAKKERLESIKDRFETMKSKIRGRADYSFENFKTDVLGCVERDYRTLTTVSTNNCHHRFDVCLKGFSAEVVDREEETNENLIPSWQQAIMAPVVQQTI